MQLTKYTDFALRTLIFLGVQRSDERVTISQVSEYFDIPRNHLIKIVHHLGKLGYVDTIRGKGGGIRLGRALQDINLRAVVESTEETLTPVNCYSPRCPLAVGCRLKNALYNAQEAFMRELENYSLADLCQRPLEIEQLLHWSPEQRLHG